MNQRQAKISRLKYFSDSWKVDRKATVGTVVSQLLLPFVLLLQTILLSHLIDSILRSIESTGPTDFWLLLCVLLLWVVNEVLQITNKIFTEQLKLALSEKLSLELLEKKALIEYRVLEETDVLELMARVGRDPSQQWLSGMSNLIEITSLVIHTFGILGLIAVNSWIIAVFVGVLIIPYYFISLRNGQEEYTAYIESAEHFRKADYFRKMISSRENADERALFQYAPWVNKKWSQEYNQAISIEKKANGVVFSRVGCTNILSAIILGAICLVMLREVYTEQLSVGLYISIIHAIIRYIEVITSRFSTVFKEFVKAKLFLEDYCTILGLNEEEHSCPSMGKKTIDYIESIVFSGVSFTYPHTKVKVLDNLNLVLEGNKHYAFVGINGAGKTTIIKLLCGFYEDYDGIIRINGIDIRSIPKDDLRKMFSIVYQDYAKYAMSLAENLIPNEISSGDNSLRIQSVLKAVGLWDIVASWENGINTMLGRLDQTAVDLSGGQWQLLAIARSLLSDAPIHVLDEPTASINPVLEAKLYKVFQDELAQEFTITITHRMGAARFADRIVVLADGCVAELGTHEELLEHKGIYSKMFHEQRSWYFDDSK